MRNAFVVLAFCIGLASGFIVPSSAPEHASNKYSSNMDTSMNTKLFTENGVLPKSRNNIDEKDLYEHATEKKNNQNERSFIYIKQKYSKNIRNKLIKMSPIDMTDFVSPVPLTLSIFNAGPSLNTHFQRFDVDDNKLHQDMSSPYFGAQNSIGFKINDEHKKIEKIHGKVLVPVSNRIDVRRDYFELLKPPILRSTMTRLRTKAKQENMHEIKIPLLSPSSIPFRDNYKKKINFKNQYISAPALQRNDVRKKYGFDVSFVRRSFEPKKTANKAEDASIEKDFLNDYDLRKTWENHEDDKLLNKYLKDTLEERDNPMQDLDKVSPNSVDCNEQECILDTRNRNYINNGLHIKPDCSCKTRDVQTTAAP